MSLRAPGRDAWDRSRRNGSSSAPRPTSWVRAFPVNRDRTFLWLGASHGDAFEALHGAILRGCPLVVLTGETGAGKTMLADAVAARLADEDVVVGRLPHPSRDADDFWNAIVGAFDLATESGERDAAVTRLTQLVQRAARTSTRVLLIIDEAQSLTSEVLAEVVRVCDAARDAGGSSALTVLLLGEDELDLTLARPELTELAARIAVRRRLRALREREVASYVRHRLACADAPRDLFTPEALRAIAALSRGIPRLIDTVCARAAASGGVVDATTAERCAREMSWLAGPDARSLDVARRRRRWGRRSIVMAALASAAVLALTASTVDDAPRPARRPEGATPAAGATAVVAPTPPGHIARDPDPGAIIDWLLDARSRPTAVGR